MISGEKGGKNCSTKYRWVLGYPWLGKTHPITTVHPTTNGDVQNESSVGISTRVFARWVPILFAQSVLINRISALKLSRKFIKSALLVGYSSPPLSPKILLPEQNFSSSTSSVPLPCSLLQPPNPSPELPFFGCRKMGESRESKKKKRGREKRGRRRRKCIRIKIQSCPLPLP